jgi:hypothetical protein
MIFVLLKGGVGFEVGFELDSPKLTLTRGDSRNVTAGSSKEFFAGLSASAVYS